jgi:hypothetical protein
MNERVPAPHDVRFAATLLLARRLEAAMTFMWRIAATITQAVTQIWDIRMPTIQELRENSSSRVNTTSQ